MACGHVCGSTTACVGGGLPWCNQGCVLPSKHFLHGGDRKALTRYEADKDVMNVLVCSRKKTGLWRESAGELALARS